MRKSHSPVEIVAAQSSSLSVQSAQTKKLVYPGATTHEPLKSGNGSSRSGSQKGRTCRSQVRAQLCPGVTGTPQHQQPCCLAAPGTVLLQALGHIDLAMEAAAELLLELLLAVEESVEFVIVDLQYINSLSQVRLIPPPTTKGRI